MKQQLKSKFTPPVAPVQMLNGKSSSWGNTIQAKQADFGFGSLALHAANTQSDTHEQQADSVADKITNNKSINPQQEISQTDTQGGLKPSHQLNQKIDSKKGNGSRLDKTTEAIMSQKMGFDFSNVKIHNDSEASKMSKSIHARAFTKGNDIFFDEKQYNPGSAAGDKLLAHELTHVAQQSDAIHRMPWQEKQRLRSIPIDYEMIADPEERMQMMREDYERIRWKNALERLTKGELEDEDLKYGPLKNRLTGLKRAEVSDLITKIKAYQQQRDKDIADPAVTDSSRKVPISTTKIVEWLEVRQEIATPMPDNAVVNRSIFGSGIDNYTITVGDVHITVLPDSSSTSGNETSVSTNFLGRLTWSTENGKVKNLKKDGVPFNPSTIEVTVHTVHAESLDGASAYGKGTTDTDKFNETTTLRVHEGQHGTDYINYITNTALPVSISGGIEGQITSAQLNSILNYVNHIADESCEATDQVGFTQDQFLATDEGRRSGIVSCRRGRRP